MLAGSLVAGAAPVAAAPMIDQSHDASDMVDLIHDVIVAGQTFTAGRTGLLTQVDVRLARLDTAGPLTVSLQATAAGKPTGTILASATVAQSSVPDDGEVHDVSVALSPTVAATSGEVYAIVLAAPQAPVDTAWIWASDTADGYSGGTALQGDTKAGTWTTIATNDRGFATWVDSTGSGSEPPTISCAATPGVLWPPNNKLAGISVAVSTAHATGFRLVSASANEGGAGDLAGWSIGLPDTSGMVRATRSGSGDGRTYSLVYEAFDSAGATASCTATVMVPHDRGSHGR